MKVGVWASIGSVVIAASSSACCWLPLLTVGLGLGAGSAAVALDRYRGLFLGAAAVLLGVGFYLNYRRETPCGPDGTCAPSRPLLRTFNRAVLWCSAALVAVFAFFPELTSAVPNKRAPEAGPGSPDSTMVVLDVGGMTCEACEAPVEQALSSLSGVRAVHADAVSGRVSLSLEPGADPADSLLGSKLAGAGYRLLRR